MKTLLLTLLLLPLFSCSSIQSKKEFTCGDFVSYLPSDWIHGYLTVPEDYADPSGTKIYVFYYGRLRKGEIPIVHFNGGPGFQSYESYLSLKNRNESLVFIDQRGTGCSSLYPTGVDNNTLERLQFYNSTNIVKDAEAIRKNLQGNKKWIVFGQSYGGLIAHRYVVTAPNGLAAAFSHGFALVDESWIRFKNRIRGQERVLAAYFKRYPSDRKKVQILSQELSNDSCVARSDIKKKLCGVSITAHLSKYLANVSVWSLLHDWLEHLIKFDELDAVAIRDLGNHIISYPNTFANLSTPGVVIAHTDYTNVFHSKTSCIKVMKELENEGISIHNNPINECAPFIKDVEKHIHPMSMIKELARNHLTLEKFTSVLKHHPEVNFYLYSGELDAIVPKEDFEAEASKLKKIPNSFYRHFDKTGHEGYLFEDQIWTDLKKESITL